MSTETEKPKWELEKEENFIYEPADLADPKWHAHYHTMCMKDRERFDDELEELRSENVDLLLRLEKLERTVKKLDSIINWDNVWSLVQEDLKRVKFG